MPISPDIPSPPAEPPVSTPEVTPMTGENSPAAREPLPPRVLDGFDGGLPGPVTLLLTAMHGNEPAGVIAAQRVIESLRALAPTFRGRVHLLLGNRQAFAARVRFVESDLNRAFPIPPVRLPDCAALGTAESMERDELLRTLRDLTEAREPQFDLFAIDLHTFSSDGPPFAVFADTIRNRRFASCWPVPRILGLVESLPGTLSEYLTEAGCISAVFEGGRHEDPRSQDRLEAAIRLALVAAGHVDEEVFPEIEEDRTMLATAARNVPSVLDVRHRHGVRRDDAFHMRPGYRNFQRIRSGERLADTAKGPVLAPKNGLILLPLYQAQGDDGFFVARSIGRFWLVISTLLRTLRLGALMPLLPGVRRHPALPRGIEVDPRVARFLAGDILHALGYRSVRSEGPRLALVRRRHDLRRPRDVSIAAEDHA